MRHIAIIGSGQAGLLTAHGLRKAGYEVTLYSDRTPEQYLTESRPTGTAGRFCIALDYERELDLNNWEKEALPFTGIYLIFCLKPNKPFITLSGRLEKVGYAIDLRLQSHRWMHELEARGGKVVIESVNVPRLDEIAAENDLTVVATGRGDIADLFERDPERSPYDKPQRILAMMIVKNAKNFDQLPFRPVKFNFVASDGEAFWVPYHHKDLGFTWNLLFEAKAGGVLDRFQAAKNGHEVVEIGKQTIKEIFPWDYEWAKDMELADEHGWLVGKFPPTIRRPVGHLPSGRVVTAVGDTIMNFDPLAGQGANNGNKMARNLVESVVERGDQPFDADWMLATFEKYYNDQGKATNLLSNLLLEPITNAGKELLIAQYGSTGTPQDRRGKQLIANGFVDNFADPRTFTPLFTDMQQARKYIAKTTGKPWIYSAVTGRFAVIRDQVRQVLGLPPSVGYW